MMLVRMVSLQRFKSLLVLFALFMVVACSGGGGGSSSPLSWVPPFERVDGSALSPSEIAGYRVYYGTEKGVYTGEISVEDDKVDDAQLSAIPKGKYFVVVTAIDTDGRESAYSNVVEVSL